MADVLGAERGQYINVGLIGLAANLVVLAATWIAVGRRVQPSAQLEPVVSRSASG